MVPPASSADKRPPTIHDVAALAEVAASTVSRAFSAPERVNARTRERIEEAAARVGYRPNTRANGRLGRSATVALVLPDVTNPFYFDIIRGTQLQLKAAGHSLLLVDTEESRDVEAALLDDLTRTVEGAVLTASRLSDDDLLEVAHRLPIVTINRSVDGVPTTIIDTPSGVEQSMEHLVSLGHRSIAYVSGPESSWSNARRWTSIQTAADRLGVDVVKIGPFSPKTTSGAAAADAVINSGATASIAFNDLVAIGMLQRFAGRGVVVPDEISVVGCDDIFGADFCSPPLTTLTTQGEQAGRTAASMLIDRLSGTGRVANRSETVLSTHLTIRESTGPAPVEASSP